MKKKLIISLSVLVGLVAILVTLCFTVFTVKSIEINFRTSQIKSWSNEQIIEESGLPKGKNIFSIKEQPYIDRLEKKFPYLKVINIETKFPSTLVIHCAEREEMFVVQRESDYLICDDSLKILKIEEGVFVSDNTNPIILKDLTILNESIEEGDFLQTQEAGVTGIYSGIIQCNRLRSDMIGMIKEISFKIEHNNLTNKDETNMTMTLFSGREVKILNIDTSLGLKFSKMYFALSNIYEILMENGDYTEEEVDRCSLLLGNQITDQKEIYCHIYLDGVQVASPNKSSD